MIEQTPNYILHREENREYLTFPQFDQYSQLTHLFTTRKGGVSQGPYESWNFGFPSGDNREAVTQNYQILAQTAGTDLSHLVLSAQTHTTNIRVVTREDKGKGLTRQKDYQDVDGFITQEPKIGIITAHADCMPVFFFDPVRNVIGLAHSGWKGTLGRISEKMIALMVKEFSCNTQDILVGIGPSLCGDCFEIGDDVAQRFFQDDESYRRFAIQRNDKYYLDLWKVNEQIIRNSEILPEHISNMRLCTKCHPDLFFSHRAQGVKRGVMAAFMMIQ